MVRNSTASAKLRRKLPVEQLEFGFDRRGNLHPKKALLERAAGSLGFSLPGSQAPTWAVALALTGLVGVTYWTPFLEAWGMESLGVDLRLMGAALSLAVLLGMFKGLVPVHQSLLSHQGYRWEAVSGTAFAAALALAEFAAIAYGLASQHSSILNPAQAYLPYLAGLLVTAMNLAAAYFLARNHARNRAAHTLALAWLARPPYEPRVQRAFAEFQALREEAEREAELPTLVVLSGPAPQQLPPGGEPAALPPAPPAPGPTRA